MMSPEKHGESSQCYRKFLRKSVLLCFLLLYSWLSFPSPAERKEVVKGRKKENREPESCEGISRL